MEEGVTRQASLISQRGYELVTQIVLGIQRVVMDTRGGQGAREDLNANGASCWQSICAKTRNRVRVRWIAVKVVHARGKGIDNTALRQPLRTTQIGRAALAHCRKYDHTRIIDDSGPNNALFP